MLEKWVRYEKPQRKKELEKMNYEISAAVVVIVVLVVSVVYLGGQ